MSSAFKHYPIIEYDLNKYIRDYWFRVVFYNTYVQDNIKNFEIYNLQHGDTPEALSRQFYKNDQYWYLILLVNNIEDPFYEWNLSDEECMNYAKKYVENEYSSLTGDDKEDKISEIYTQVINNNKSQIYLPNSEIIGFLHEEFIKMVKSESAR